MLSALEGKSILIMGFGREGRSTLAFLRQNLPGARVGIADEANNISLPEELPFYTGEDAFLAADKYDLVIKSPGVVLKRPLPRDKITSQTELFLSEFRENTIGITGTKGKSTTASLIAHVLKSAGRDTVLAGNIGLPVLDTVGSIKKDTAVVFELSSHQLEYVDVSPRTAVYLNLYPEHLDHYGSFEKYALAKQNIYRHQKKGDILICGEDVVPAEHAAELFVMGPGRDVYCENNTINFKKESLNLDPAGISLKGAHNMYNIAAAYAASRLAGVLPALFEAALKSFKPLPHRLQPLGEHGGIIYYNDSISTIPQTAITALQSVGKADTLILGGMDRGVDYTPLAEYLVKSGVKAVILMPDTGVRIGRLLEECGFEGKIIPVSGLEAAVEAAKKETPRGGVCVFSPAAASYGFFKNFEERGERFKALVADEK